MEAEAIAGEEERDLLRRFAGSSQADERPEASLGDSGEVELSLGLSLGGCFGVEPSKKKLVRSSSIASLSMLPTTEHKLELAATLARTCSLPTEAEEEQRKRKEIQSLKRLEAKRKRLEKRSSRSLPAAKDRLEDEDVGGARFRGSAGGASSSGPPPWTAAAPGRAARRQVPAGSTVSSSSAVSDFESRKLQGLNISGLSRAASNPSILQPMPENPSHQAATTPPMATGSSISCSREENPLSKETVMGGNGTGDMERSMMEDMPCVSTKGDGPNGKRIEGFLYKYRKGEEVRIMCVCHGSFLTPAEFVRHAGGGDVAHPLRHIVVNPTPSTFL